MKIYYEELQKIDARLEELSRMAFACEELHRMVIKEICDKMDGLGICLARGW